MQITPNEIETVEDAGLLDEFPVKMIRTKGGFWIAVGKPKGKFREEALAAGSHPAIVRYNLEKQFPQFQPSMMKSEGLSDSTVVERHSHFLPSELRKSGYDVYSVQNGNDIEVQLTKHNIKTASVEAKIEDEGLVIRKLIAAPNKSESEIETLSKALSGAITEKAVLCNVKKVVLGYKKDVR